MAETERNDLATFIKDVHKKLRHDFKQTQDANQVWEIHCQDTITLQKYAKSMHCLADSYWEVLSSTDPPTSRILWIKNAIFEYFFQSGIETARFKDMKLGIQPLFTQELQDLSKPLTVLDVGSCYNPFSKFEELDVLGIDLSPAVESVWQCDFLNVELEPNLRLNPPLRTVESLPTLTYNAVIFSLLLEYLPSTEQRLVCCTKAYEVLKYEGLLLIVTPDSKHATANAKGMKSWRIALEILGFRRVSYEKLRHVHCMAFRKVGYPKPDVDRAELAGMLYISQDSNEETLDVETVPISRTEEEAGDLVCSFGELPDMDLDD